jgi:hypothetical protein
MLTSFGGNPQPFFFKNIFFSLDLIKKYYICGKLKNMLTDTQINKLGELIYSHSNIYPKLPVKAEQFESLFSNAIGSEWNPNNHNPNEDMITEIVGMEKPSLKSGIMKNGYLTISSHRTTTYKTLEDKIDFLNSRGYDSYICLSRPDDGTIHNYKLLHFKKTLIKFDLLNWNNTYNKKGNHTGWRGVSNDNNIEVNIIKSMSDQVWIKINMDLITTIFDYEFEK